MLDEAAIRLRWDTVGSKLDERVGGWRLEWHAGAALEA